MWALLTKKLTRLLWNKSFNVRKIWQRYFSNLTVKKVLTFLALTTEKLTVLTVESVNDGKCWQR
jgi:hypothetical protein